MGQRMVRFQVSVELLREALALPEQTNILNIVRDDHYPDRFTFVVEHPDFEKVENGTLIPEINPIIEADYDKRPSTWLTFKWEEQAS